LRAFGFSFLLIFLIACKEEVQTYKISGYLYKDCNQPASGVQLLLKANPERSFSSVEILGSEIVHADGRFDIFYELKENIRGTAELQVVNSSGFKTVYTDLAVNRDHALTLFVENTSGVTLTRGGRNLNSSDTLFYGITETNIERRFIGPPKGILDSLEIGLPNRNGGAIWRILYFGVGTSDFNRSKEALNIADSSFQHIAIKLEGCFELDTFNIFVN